MSEFDDQARAAGERVRHEAERIASSIEPLGRSTRPEHRSSSRWLLAAAALMVVVAGVGGLLVAGNRNSDVDTVSPPTDPLPVSSTIAELPTTTQPASTTTATTTAPSTTEPAATSITRPIVDPAVCEPISASNGAPSGLPRDPASNLPLTLFARPSELPVPIQIIGESVDGEAKPFALVQRYFDGTRQRISSDSINGTDVFVRTYDNGNGEAEWTLADGSIGYLRSRGLDREQLMSIVGQLTPRAADASIPGFDYGNSGPEGLSLVAEQLNNDAWQGELAGSQCRVAATDLVYRISVVTGPDIFTFGGVIDRSPPLSVGVVGDSVVIVSGLDDPSAPRADEVIDADEETWRQLLIAPEPEFEFPQMIGGDAEVVVDFVPIDDTSTPVSSLTLRVEVTDGVAFLEVYASDAIVADTAEYWKTEIDGRIRSRSSAIPGEVSGVFGSRLGDAPLTEEFTVRISTTDGDDQTIQTTGEIRLFPNLP